MAGLQHVLDARRRPLEVLGPVVHLTRIEHAVTTTADVDESGLHAGKHILNAAQVHVSDHRRRTLPGYIVLDEHVFLEHRDLVSFAPLGDHHQLVGDARGKDRGLPPASPVATGAAAPVAASLDAAGRPARGDLLLDRQLFGPTSGSSAPRAGVAWNVGNRVIALGLFGLRLGRGIDPIYVDDPGAPAAGTPSPASSAPAATSAG